MVTFCPRCKRTFDDGVSFCPVDGAPVSKGGATDDRNLGRTLGNQFEILDVCGRGAMGMVYRAQQRTMDRIVAVKILRRELLAEPDVVRRFVREARAAAKLQHPNIVTVHMVGETDDGLPFLVMEYVDGVSLEAMCEGTEPLGVLRAVRIARQISAALEEAHTAGIIHRDLKPANILIHEKGTKSDRVKVLDFGIAKIVQPDGAGESILTRDGMIFGTPHYIAPEQATGSEVDARADLYSLGIVMFRMVTGRLPFEGTAGMQVVLRHLREAPASPRAINPAVPPALDALILQCLAKDRADRPASADAISTELTWIEEALPPDGTVQPPRSGNTAKVKTVVPATTAEVTAVPPSWKKRVAWGGVAIAIAGGATIGIVAARSQTTPEDDAPAAVAAIAPAPIAPAHEAPLVDEHVLAEDGITLRAGFAHEPGLGAAELAVIFSGVSGTPQVEVGVATETGREQITPAHFVASESRWHASLTLGAGKQHVRVIAHTPKGPPLVLAFDVEPHGFAPPLVTRPALLAHPPTAARPVAVERNSHARPSKEDDLPVTIVAPDPHPPRAILADPAPPTQPYPTTRVVVDHPKPTREPPPAPEHPAEDPPTRINDPTTLPPPSPDDPH